MLFTTSWDDGYLLDRRVATLLERFGCTGTFYICPRAQHGDRMLSPADIREIATRHEIGAHTLTHPHLPDLPPALCKQEIEDSKAWVEDITGNPCTMFCYPYGDWNTEVRHRVQDAGFLGARTTQGLEYISSDDFAMPTTLQIMPFPKRPQWKAWWHPLDPLGPLRVRFRKLRKLNTPLRAMKNWQSLAQALFLHGKETGAHHFHLWGHSREIEKYGMWGELETFLKFVSAIPEIKSVNNSELLR